MEVVLMSISIAVNQVSKSFGKKIVLNKIDLNIEEGQIYGFIGPSGAGKSTLLHLLGGLDIPTRGTVRFDGTNIFNWNAAELAHFRNSHIGFVFQFHHLLPEFTVLENAMMPMMIRGNVRGEMEQAAIRVLERVGLGHRISHQVGEISGGEQQRVAIARSLVGGPQLLLADEPTGNLDHRTGMTIFEMIRELHVERGLTSVIATHNEKIASLCDEVWELNEGVFALARL
jgi:lipoprotein-releasing system ATP-binding protein